MNKYNTKINGCGPTNSTGVPEQPFDTDSLETILNYKFKDKSLLVQAFTDSSYDEKCVSYERLEYFGDTVLNMIITEEFFHLYPEADPGSLTYLRADNVDTEKLARVAVKHKLYRYLRHKKPLLGDQIAEFIKELKEKTHPLHSHGLLKVPKSLADIVESTIGALYMDCKSTKTVWKVIKPLLEPIIPLDKLKKHPMTELNEMCQKRNLKLTHEDTWDENKAFLFYIDDHLVGHGHHLVKKETARNCAARDAINNFPKFFGDI